MNKFIHNIRIFLSYTINNSHNKTWRGMQEHTIDEMEERQQFCVTFKQ